MPSSAAENDLPSMIAEKCNGLLPRLLAEMDEDRILEMVDRVVATDRWNSFDRFHETSRALMTAYETAGARAECYSIPTGGIAGNGQWIIPEAEDISDATLDIISPVSKRLADYRQCPWHVAQWSAP